MNVHQSVRLLKPSVILKLPTSSFFFVSTDSLDYPINKFLRLVADMPELLVSIKNSFSRFQGGNHWI